MTRNIDEIAEKLAHGLSLDEMRRRAEKHTEAHIPEKSEAEREYWNTKVWAGQKRVEFHTRKPLCLEMEYNAARMKFWKILQTRAAHIMALESRAFEWVFTDAEKDILQNLVRYFINDPACKYDLAKGLFLYGAPGTGKTEIMRALQKFAEQEEMQKRFEWTNLSETYTLAKTDKEYNPVVQNVTMNRAFDEFGRYSGGVIRFGDTLDINEAIIEQRYERWKRYGQFSFFIANVTPNDLQNLVSPMLLDRIREMCTSVLFPGQSKRK